MRPRLFSGRLSLPGVLAVASLLVYAATRLWALDEYPITFFGDEAILVNTAQRLIQNGWRDSTGRLLPLYFESAVSRWIPDLGVYLQAATSGLFGRSIEITRATFAIPTVIAAAALALLLRRFFSLRHAWIVILVLALLPAWFHHSRIAFETVLATSCFALFLLAYFYYRFQSPRYLPLAVLAGAATFYSYSNSQAVTGLTAILLFVSDLRYHLRHWRHLLIGLALAAALAVPFLQFRAAHPGAMLLHLRQVNSYWFLDTTPTEKLAEFGRRYASALDPRYWFTRHHRDLDRHLVNGRAHLPLATLPLLVLGAGVCLWQVRDARYRAILLALIATPAGAATVDITITRVLPFVVPAALIMTLGLSTLLGWVERLLRRSRRIDRLVPAPTLPIAAFLVLIAGVFALTADAFARGPTWHPDYGLYGMQWGARPIFEELLPQIYAENRGADVVLSPNWANATDQFAWFFLDFGVAAHLRFESPESWIEEVRPAPPNLLIIATENEYQRLVADPKMASVAVLRTLPYPTGAPGFRVVRLTYREDAAEILARAVEERRQPQESVVTIDGQEVRVVHSRLDIGRMVDLFDGIRGGSLARGLEANPFVLDFSFPEPKSLSGLAVAVASMNFTLRAEIWKPGDPGPDAPISYDFKFGEPTGPVLMEPSVEVSFDRGPHLAERVRLSVHNDRAGSEAKIHLREIEFR